MWRPPAPLPPARIFPPLTWGTLSYRTQGLRQSRDAEQLSLLVYSKHLPGVRLWAGVAAKLGRWVLVTWDKCSADRGPTMVGMTRAKAASHFLSSLILISKM